MTLVNKSASFVYNVANNRFPNFWQDGLPYSVLESNVGFGDMFFWHGGLPVKTVLNNGITNVAATPPTHFFKNGAPYPVIDTGIGLGTMQYWDDGLPVEAILNAVAGKSSTIKFNTQEKLHPYWENGLPFSVVDAGISYGGMQYWEDGLPVKAITGIDYSLNNFWLDGLPCPVVNTGVDLGGLRYWTEGLPVRAIINTLTITKTSTLVNNVKTLVNKSETLKYNVNFTQPVVTKDGVLKFNVKVTAGKNTTNIFNIKNLAAKSETLRYNALTRISKEGGALWKVSGPVALPLLLTWRSLEKFAVERSIEWKNKFLVSGVRDTLWNDRAKAVQENSLVWDVFYVARAQQNFSIIWNLISNVSAESTPIWNSLATVATLEDLLWNDLITVSKDDSYIWKLRRLASKNRTLLYNDYNKVNTFYTINWSMGTSVTSEIDLKWLVLHLPVINRVEFDVFITRLLEQDVIITKSKPFDFSITKKKIFP